jgi:superfamily II DNA or RNA helicase
MGSLAPLLTPRGHLLATRQDDAPALPAETEQGLVSAFALGAGHGLLLLGAQQVGTVLPPAWGWWRDLAARYVCSVCALAEFQETEAASAIHVPRQGDPNLAPPPDEDSMRALIADAPPMVGVETLSPPLLATLWVELDAALQSAWAASKLTLQAFLKAQHPAWNLVGRVHFNLAENRKDPQAPFAFLATYTSRLSARGAAQHLPLSKALAEFSDGKSRSRLLALLTPVQRAAEQCGWLQEMVAQGEIYHPLRWTPADALRLLADTPQLQAAGIVVRAPGTWPGGRPPRPRVSASIGERPPSLLGQNALLDFNMSVSLDGETLSASEIKALLAGGDGLQLLRGRWVEVDRNKLKRLIARFQAIEKLAATTGLDFAQAQRLVAGAALASDGGANTPDVSDEAADADWSQLTAGPWLAETLRGLRQPEGLAAVSAGKQLLATLRPYQDAGVRWLYLLCRLRLGACLADDMGLGKTIQVLALLLVLAREEPKGGPSLLVVPASLLANWAAEAQRFAPSLRLLMVHPAYLPAADSLALKSAQLKRYDLVVTSYATLARVPALAAMDWRLAVLDEAQAIKNPGAQQTRQVKTLKAQTRIALTGTPVENRLSDLWSIFDFTHPGLLGSGKVFATFSKRLAQTGHYGPLRELVRPYILRRLKTDKRVIADLPDKTELKAWCHLRPAQAALYERAVRELASALEDADGMSRKGVVLAALMRFKQICNHPSQWLGDAAWAEADSGKFARLRELAEVIAAKQEKVLVFTQFRETTQPLAAFLGAVFGRAGLVLHGGTPVAQRRETVKKFQDDELTPFFVLSLKAGGAGLNLTAASHVIHFDRWWNPAVENQATDRAFRIGQQRNVMVHKFVCRGTIEERIDTLIESKQALVNDVLEGGPELQLTEMSDRQLLDLVRLDIHAAQEI